MSYQIVIADSHWMVRAGLHAVLARESATYTCTGEANDVATAVQCTLALAPDLVLIDSQLPDAGGLAAARLIRAERPQQTVLLMADAARTDTVRDALRAGCSGLVRKHTHEAELLEALRCVRLGGVYLDAEQARLLAQAESRSTQAAPMGPLGELSARELSVFRLIAEGHTNRAAGASLQLSPKTVEKYRAALMFKLKLRSAVDLRLLALELGVVQRPDKRGPPQLS